MAKIKKVELNENRTFKVYNIEEVLDIENNLVSIAKISDTSIDLEGIDAQIALFKDRVAEWEDVKAQALLLEQS